MPFTDFEQFFFENFLGHLGFGRWWRQNSWRVSEEIYSNLVVVFITAHIFLGGRGGQKGPLEIVRRRWRETFLYLH